MDVFRELLALNAPQPIPDREGEALAAHVYIAHRRLYLVSLLELREGLLLGLIGPLAEVVLVDEPLDVPEDANKTRSR